jgi:hypothetical protein
MKRCKARVEEIEDFPITIQEIEARALKDMPWYQADDKGKETHYAVCPACDNPVQIIGLYKLPEPYARHHNKTVKKLAVFNAEALENCPLYLPRARPVKNARRKSIKGIPLKILTRLISEFGVIAAFLKDAMGISYSKALLEKMLETYKAERGYLYTGASLINIPWIFAYMSDSQSLYGQFIKNPGLLNAIRKEIPQAQITADGQIKSKDQGGKPQFFSLKICFLHHKTDFADNTLNEKMTMVVSTGQSRIIYEEKIVFAHNAYQEKLLTKDAGADKALITLAENILGGLISL